jgi:hypothetical protein
MALPALDFALQEVRFGARARMKTLATLTHFLQIHSCNHSSRETLVFSGGQCEKP